MFEWFGVDFNDAETLSAKFLLDKKCLAQLNLKVDKERDLFQCEPPQLYPPPIIGSSSHWQGHEAFSKYLDFVLEVWENQ